jgi:hypothetical protein
VLADRYLHDRSRARSKRDVDDYLDGRLELEGLGRRRLARLALGPSSPATTAASSLLVGAGWAKLVARAETTGSTHRRLQALTILVRASFPDAVTLIRGAVGEGDPALTTSLLRLAGELQTTDADALLLEVLVDGTHPRSRTATELEPRASRLHEDLVALASADDPALRYWAIKLLAPETHEPSVALAVAACAGDPEANVRAAAAEALGGVNMRAARPLLRRLLHDDAFFVRSHAARSVAAAGDRSLASDLLPLLADQNWWVRSAAKESLLHLGRAGLEVAQAALTHKDGFARDGAFEIILGSGHLPELMAAAAAGDSAAQEAVTAIRAQTSGWSITAQPAVLVSAAKHPAAKHQAPPSDDAAAVA